MTGSVKPWATALASHVGASVPAPAVLPFFPLAAYATGRQCKKAHVLRDHR